MTLSTDHILAHATHISGELRLKTLSLYNQAHAGHIGCSLSCIDLMIGVLLLHKAEKDTFILSKGHAAAALYASLNWLGEISDDVLATYYLDGTTLPAHPAPGQFKGIPFATGSLGHGLPIATGIAHAARIMDEDSYAYVLLSDGETNEGTTWEAAHFAMQHKLDNLIMIIDKNGLQGFGTTNEVLGDTADPAKWTAIGFETVEVNGHDIEEIYSTVKTLKTHKNGLPKAIIAHTVKGKGVSYMENKLEWHYLPMNPEQYEAATHEIQERYFNIAANA
ncbi:transketolase [Arundinibacter roseus]|uniref:Transketolase n=1 Tax=Arundinibacter roseus TaxID=2070510 RepID=A0A4R4KA60_9BACT|nr:transketolase [Arundinibacter roseus]TDB64433.1 transketolase [Arundinibacter roseus]